MSEDQVDSPLEAPEPFQDQLDELKDKSVTTPPAAEPTPAAEPSVADVRQELASQPKVKIMISATEQDKDDVVAGVNGVVYQIKRNEWVEVPESVVEVLENAVQTLYTQCKRADGEGNELIATDAQRISFNQKR